MLLYNPTVSGSLLITGSLTTTGTLTAQTLVVQTITSSVDFVTGSSVNGSLSSNTHQFTGSVLMSGSVGIGTSSPSGILDVIGTNILLGATSKVVLSYNLGTSANSNSPELAFYGQSYDAASSIYGPSIQAINQTTFARKDLVFYQHNAADFTNRYEAMRLTYAGNLGIGTTSPDALLTVAGANQATGAVFNTYGNVLIHSTDSYAINKGGALSLGGKYNSAGTPIATFARIHGKKENATVDSTAGYLSFETVPEATATLTERMRITSTGNVGIGTTTPTAILDVDGAASSTISALTIRQGSGATAYGQIVVKDDRFHGLILRGIPASTANLSVTAGDQMSFY